MRQTHCGRGSLSTAPESASERRHGDYPPPSQGVLYGFAHNRKRYALRSVRFRTQARYKCVTFCAVAHICVGMYADS